MAGYSVAACNSPYYGGGMHLAPGARLDDGLLDIVLIAQMAKRSYLAALPGVFSGHARRQPAPCGSSAAASCTSTPTARSRSTPTATRSATTPATITVVPRALRVLVPA